MAHYNRKLMTVLLFAFLYSRALAQEGADTAIKQAVNGLLHGGDVQGITQYKMPEFTVVLGPEKEINAWAEVSSHTIRVTRPLINVMSEGELAFVIAHEVGHIQDSDCPTRGAKAHLSGTALKRMCEAAADQIAVQYLMAAGYSPFEGAGVIGKLLMADPAQGSILGIVLGRFLSDHPVSVDRIKQLGQYAAQACHERSELCPQ